MPDTETPSADPHCPCQAADTLGRRTMLGVVVAGAGSLVLGGLGLVAGFLNNAVGRPRERSWIRLGDVNDADVLNVETFRRHVVRVEHMHAWQRRRVPLDVYIKDLYPDPPLALLSTCSHLGCAVAWKGEARQFQCPCHGGRYDEQGRVISGPPPRPLTRLEVKIEDDQCYVRLPDGQGSAA